MKRTGWVVAWILLAAAVWASPFARVSNAVGEYGKQYYFDYPPANPLVRSILVSPGLSFPDGSISYKKGSPAYEWTAAAIDDARAKGIPWVVVGAHKQCMSMAR